MSDALAQTAASEVGVMRGIQSHSAAGIDAGPLFRRRRAAFTLMELLVVVAIMALLIAILVPSLAGAREAGRAAVCLSNLKQIGHAIQMYTQDNGSVLPGPTSPLLFRSTVNLTGLGGPALSWARQNLPYRLSLYMGGSEKGAAAFDVISVCPSAEGAPLTTVYGGLPYPLNTQRCYYIANTGGIEHGVNVPKARPWYATSPVNYFGYLRSNDRPDLWPDYEKTRRMPKNVQRIRNHSKEWAIADLWHWQARPPRTEIRNVGTWPFPLTLSAVPNFCYMTPNYNVPCQPFHNTTRRFSPKGTDCELGSPRLLSGKTNAVYLDGHADPLRDWKGTVNPCFQFEIRTGLCTEGL